jgi:hypothetical protein
MIPIGKVVSATGLPVTVTVGLTRTDAPRTMISARVPTSAASVPLTDLSTARRPLVDGVEAAPPETGALVAEIPSLIEDQGGGATPVDPRNEDVPVTGADSAAVGDRTVPRVIPTAINPGTTDLAKAVPDPMANVVRVVSTETARIAAPRIVVDSVTTVLVAMIVIPVIAPVAGRAIVLNGGVPAPETRIVARGLTINAETFPETNAVTAANAPSSAIAVNGPSSGMIAAVHPTDGTTAGTSSLVPHGVVTLAPGETGTIVTATGTVTTVTVSVAATADSTEGMNVAAVRNVAIGTTGETVSPETTASPAITASTAVIVTTGAIAWDETAVTIGTTRSDVFRRVWSRAPMSRPSARNSSALLCRGR